MPQAQLKPPMPSEPPHAETQRSSMAQTFRYALEGIGYTVRTQRNMKIHLIAAVCAVILSAFLCLTPGEWAVVLILIALVLATEMLNTALEVIVDLVSPEYHPLAKIAKDVGAGMVLVFAILAVIAGCVIFTTAAWRLIG